MTTQSTQITVDIQIDVGYIGESHALISYQVTAPSKKGTHHHVNANRYFVKVADVEQVCQQIYANPIDPQIDPQFEHQHFSYTFKRGGARYVNAHSFLHANIRDGKVFDILNTIITPQRVNLGPVDDTLVLNLVGSMTLPALISMCYFTDTGVEDITLDNDCLDIQKAREALRQYPNIEASITTVPMHIGFPSGFKSLDIIFESEPFHYAIRDAVIAHKQACEQDPSLTMPSLDTIAFNAVIAPIVLPFAINKA